jgi:glutamate dehydrogenase (NADP+)
MIQHASKGSETFAGKRVVVSGSGNVAQYAALKVIELGGTVVSLSDSQGSLITESSEGFTPAEIESIADLKVARKQLSSIFSAGAENTLFSESKFKYIPNVRPWLHVGKVDVALPCATQNEISSEEAQGLIDAGVKYVAEGSNMGSTQGAIDIFEAHREKNDNSIWYAPGKAANLGGVAVSGLEMAQNSARLSWTREEVDSKLQNIMKSSFENGLETAKSFISEGADVLPSLVAGSNIAGFMKVAAAMKDQGDWW